MTRQNRSTGHDSRRIDELLEDPYAYDQALRDIGERAESGKLLVFPVARTHTIEHFIVEETPDEGSGAVARWVALLDQAEELQANVSAEDPCAQKQVRRAIDSLFLYEHQLTPDTRRQAREFLWQRDRLEPLPSPVARLQWANCRCRNCRVERALGRPSVAVSGVILPTPSLPSEATPLQSTTKQRHLWLVSEQAS